MVDLNLLTAPAILMTASSRLKTEEKTSFRLSYFCVISACFTCKPATMPCGPAVQNQASHMKMTELQ